MTDTVISVHSLGKRYRLGTSGARYETLRDRIAAAFRGTLRGVAGSQWKRTLRDGMFWALKDVSFEVKNGDTVGIIGRNGAGKSTLLKILSRVTEPTEGSADITGRVGSLLEVGTGFHPELTGRENIFLNGSILGMRRTEIQRKFDQIVAFSEVERHIDTPVKHYSSGMYVRLAFAVAAHMEPDILVVDEVLAVGDIAFQRKCLGKMRDVNAAGRTVLFVSHNMSAITSLCSRGILLEKGRLVSQGTSKQVVAEYLAGSIGASASAEWSEDERNPGELGFRLHSVRVVNAEGKPVSVVSVEEPLALTLSYSVIVPSVKFRCAMSFYTAGVCAFTTVEPFEAERMQGKRYCSAVSIPGNVFAEGEYTVNISVFASRGKKLHLCRLDSVVAFQVFDPVTGNSARGDYTEGLGGVVRPKLDWHTEAVEREM